MVDDALRDATMVTVKPFSDDYCHNVLVLLGKQSSCGIVIITITTLAVDVGIVVAFGRGRQGITDK